MRRALSFAAKTLREALREKQISVIFLLFPAFLCFIYFSAFGSGRMADWMRVAVADLDRSAESRALIASLDAAAMGEGKALGLFPLDSEEGARAMAQEGQALIALAVRKGYGEALREGGEGTASRFAVLHADPASENALVAKSIVLDAIRGSRADFAASSALEYSFTEGTGNSNDFLTGVPGLIVFGGLFATVTAALLLSREREKGGLRRIAMAPRTGGPMLLGFSLATLLLCLLQAILAFLVARALGFEPRSGLLAPLAALLLLGLASLGLGFIAAAFSRSDPQALSLSTILFAAGAFLSDSVFPLPPLLPFELGGLALSLRDFLPPSHATEIIKGSLVFGKDPGELLVPLGALAAQAALLLAIGGWIYSRRRLSPRGLADKE